jgi:hypothetical protein
MGQSPVDSEIHPVVVVSVTAFAVGIDVDRYGAARAEALVVAKFLVVLLNKDGVVQKAAALSVLSVICSGSPNACKRCSQSRPLTAVLRHAI